MAKYVVSENAEGAFRTLQDALARAKADAAHMKKGEPIHIVVQGLLHLQETIHLTEKDLPDSGHPVLVEGADENSGFSGGMPVTGFTRWKDNIWRVRVPEAAYTRHLYVDGKFVRRPATEMRRPYRWDVLEAEDFVFSNLPGEEEIKIQIEDVYMNMVDSVEWTGIATTHTEIAGWRNIRDVEMVFESGWVHRIIPMESVQMLPDGRLYIKPLEPAFKTSRSRGGVKTGGCPTYIDNVFELLGKPMEWYFDRTEQMLYLGLEEGDTPDNHEIVIPLVEQLMMIQGKTEQKICHLCFKNLRFMHNTWLHPQKYGAPENQAGQLIYRELLPEFIKEKPFEVDYLKTMYAIRVLAAKDVSFEDYVFTDLGSGALIYEFGAQDCRIRGNRFYEIAGGAVLLGDALTIDVDMPGMPDLPSRGHHPEDRREIVCGIDVSNNHIHHTGLELRGSVAVLAGYVQDVSIMHNDIHDVSYTAISLGWGWGMVDVEVGPMCPTPWKEPTICMRNRIMYNHIHHCMQGLCDGGAVYTLGCMPGSCIIGNYIHDSSNYSGDGYDGISIDGWGCKDVHDPAAEAFFASSGVPGGIYLDCGTQGVEIRDNVFHDVPVPIHYNNMIDLGYTRVTFGENFINKRESDPDFPWEIVSCAGREPAYR